MQIYWEYQLKHPAVRKSEHWTYDANFTLSNLCHIKRLVVPRIMSLPASIHSNSDTLDLLALQCSADIYT